MSDLHSLDKEWSGHYALYGSIVRWPNAGPKKESAKSESIRCSIWVLDLWLIATTNTSSSFHHESDTVALVMKHFLIRVYSSGGIATEWVYHETVFLVKDEDVPVFLALLKTDVLAQSTEG